MIGNRIKILLIGFFLISIQTAWGEDVEVTSIVNSTKIGINDQLVLTVTISGADANKADEPQFSMTDFIISRTGSSTQMNIINFKTSVTKTFTYVLTPKKIGSFDVGAVSVPVNGKVYKAPATRVEVVKDSTVPQVRSNGKTNEANRNEDIYVTGITDKNEVYIGEQITYTFELYNRLSLSDTRYEPPATTGFWLVDLQEIPRSIKVSNERQYYYNVVKTALFPTTSGELTIGSATLIYTTQAGFFSTGPTRTITTEPIPIKVKQLPADGKPSDFGGAVGRFIISSTIDNTTVKAGNVITIHVSVTGEGNLDLVTSLGEPDFSDFKTYDPKVTEKISNSGFVVGGTKTWEYIIIPREPGKITLKPFRISYFDPSDESYHTASTQPFELTITPGDITLSSQTGTDGQRSAITNIASDIRYIKSDKTKLTNVQRRVYTSEYFYLLYILPFGLLIASIVFKKRQDTIERNTGLKRKLRAWKKAGKQLAEAEKILEEGDKKILCGTLHNTMTNYIGDMLNIDTGGLTASGLEKVLKENGVRSDFAERIRKTLEMCDFVRFASAENDAQIHKTMLKDTHEILTELRKIL